MHRLMLTLQNVSHKATKPQTNYGNYGDVVDGALTGSPQLRNCHSNYSNCIIGNRNWH
jgi:hypothetical protein